MQGVPKVCWRRKITVGYIAIIAGPPKIMFSDTPMKEHDILIKESLLHINLPVQLQNPTPLIEEQTTVIEKFLSSKQHNIQRKHFVVISFGPNDRN